MLSGLYGSQNYWAGENANKQVKSLMISLTIVTTYSTRTFIRELGENFLEDDELLGYIHDGFLMMSIASIDDPSNVIAIYRDESFKDRTNDLLNAYQHNSEQMKAVDELFAKLIYRMEQTLMWVPILMGLMTAHSQLAPLVSKVVCNIQNSLPLVAIVALNKARNAQKVVSNGMGAVGSAVTKLPGISHAIQRLPKPHASGIPFDAKANAGKAVGLSFSFNVIGPGFRSMVHGLSNLMTDHSEAGSLWHTIFQTGQHFKIGHYVLP